MHVRRKRTRKTLLSEKILLVGEVQAMVKQELVEAETMEEELD